MTNTDENVWVKKKNSDGTIRHFYLHDDSCLDFRNCTTNIVMGYCQSGKSNANATIMSATQYKIYYSWSNLDLRLLKSVYSHTNAKTTCRSNF